MCPGGYLYTLLCPYTPLVIPRTIVHAGNLMRGALEV